MSGIGIATDSNSGVFPEEAEKNGIYVLPMPFECEGKNYYEGKNITREEFFNKIRSGSFFQTAQPSPGDVLDLWNEALKKYDEILYIPMSSGLSGACDTAKTLAKMDEYKNKVFVVDNGRVSTPLHRSVLDAKELIEEGYSAKDIKEMLEADRDNMIIYVGLDTLENLKRGGRISGGSAVVGNILNLKPVMKFGTGLLETYKKCRGFKKAKLEMINAMKNELETSFADYYNSKEVYLLAASSADEDTTSEWVKEIEEFFPGMEVMCDYLPMGLSCHIGEGGLGIGCSCKVRRKNVNKRENR